MSHNKSLQKLLVTSLLLLLSGLALAIEGFDLADGSGLLFGSFVCEGGFTCQELYQSVRSVFWLGIYLLLPGLGLITVGTWLLSRILRRRREEKARLYENPSQKRLIATSALLALTLILFFLAPIVPFNTTLSQQPSLAAFPRVDACYQNVQAVNNPVFEYRGMESFSRALLGVGNFLYVQCTVLSGV